jgi:hypothetical protein
MGNDTIDNENEGLGGEDQGTIQGGGQNPVNPPMDNPPFPMPDPEPDPDPAPAADESGDEEFLKYVKMANDLCWIPGILKAYGADKQLQFGKIEEEEYVEDEETNKLIHPNEYDDKQQIPDDKLDEETWENETKEPVLDQEGLEEEIFNDLPWPEFEGNDDLEENVFPTVYDDKQQIPDDELEEELFSIEKCRDESAADEESPLNGSDEELEEDTFNYPHDFEDTITPWYTREVGDGEESDGDKIREMLMKLLPSEDVDGAVKDPEWTFGKFMKEKFPSYVASDRAAKFLDLVAQYSVVDAVERLAVQEAKEEVLAAADDSADQDEILALIQESADEKRRKYLADYVLPASEDEPAKYRKFWKQVLDIIKAL